MWKKYLWIKNLVFLCFVSYLLAKIGNTFLLAGMNPSGPYPSQSNAPGEIEPKPVRDQPLNHYRSISQRNVFNSDHKVENGSAPGKTAAKSNVPLQKSNLNVELIGTVVGSSEDSFAIVEDPQTRQQELFRVDDTIQDQARVVAISRCTVVVQRGGIEEILECPEPESRSNPKPAMAPPQPVAQAAPPPKREPGEIRKLSESEYVIDRGIVENALGDYNQIMTQVNIGPNIEDGRPDGLRLFHVKPGSFWAKAGLKTGDVIRRVNDLELSTVDNALKAFDTMRKEKEVLMEIRRGGTSQSINWEIE